tara:strand:+ start:1578 stop:4004 length:2427 start_codon:yes stop_codon:yes gene_type:complete
MSVEQKCPLSVPVPISLTVNTSGSVPSPVNNSHSLSASHSGFTRISEFTFTSNLTGTTSSINDLIDPPISSSLAVWDFGDGYTLSASNTPTTTHTYNVPGIYTVSVYYYDIDGNAYFNTLTETVSVYNYIETTIEASNSNVDSLSGELIPAGTIVDLPIKVETSWQDTIDTNEYTLFVAASGSKSKPYDTKSKYAHLLPHNAFYNLSNETEELITSTGAKIKTGQVNYAIEPSTSTIKHVPEYLLNEFNSVGINTYMLGSTTERLTGVNAYTVTGAVTSFTGVDHIPANNVKLGYVDDTPNTDPGVQLLVKLDTSKHRVKNFYVDDIISDINASEQSWLETGGIALKNYSGMFVKIIKPVPDFADLFSFTSTGMKEMSAINYKRQGDKFQVFIGVQDKNKNILKHYPIFLRDTSGSIGNVTGTDNTFYVNWASGGHLHTSNVSSISTNKFPYNNSTSNTELSSFLYLNIDPLSAGTWTLNVSAHIDSLDAGTTAFSGFGNTGGCIGTGSQHYTGSYTFTVYPSTNDAEFYLQNEDIDYSEVIKSYRFQSFMHEYDNLFDGVFTSFVGEASSSPTTFGKTVFSKVANFVNNHSDVDLCKIDQLQSFYDIFNEDIDILLPQPPSELKRLYDTFSTKISKLIGNYEQQTENLNSNFYTSSADGVNVDFNNPITALTYTVTAYTNFIARQKFNNEFLVIKPQKVATKNIDGSSSGESSTYALSTYNIYSNWGWELDTTVSGASGLTTMYDFYPYTTTDPTSTITNLKNNLIDYSNNNTTISRTASSIDGDWTNDNGIMYKNLDYQIRKGFSI